MALSEPSLTTFSAQTSGFVHIYLIPDRLDQHNPILINTYSTTLKAEIILPGQQPYH
jgi:hypothetical protein